MSFSSDSAGFRPTSINQPSIQQQTTQANAKQAEVKQQSLQSFGNPASGDRFSRSVLESSVAFRAIPQAENPFKNPLSAKLYPSKKDKAEGTPSANPFAAADLSSLMNEQIVDLSSRYASLSENVESAN